MTIDAVSLFGSWARGDQNANSDTDLLMLMSEVSAPRHTSMGNVSLSIYSYTDFVARAVSGDLFVWHVLFEGRAIYDPGHCFAALRDRFRLRSSYAQEIDQGAGMAWMLASFGHRYAASSMAARRAAWAVRTILIARSAEAGQPKFATADLTAIAPIAAVPRLIDQKRSAGLSQGAVLDLMEFLRWAQLSNPVPKARDEEEYRAWFKASGNVVGVNFLDALRSDAVSVDYV